MAYQSTGAKNKRRGALSKLDAMEHYYRGGFAMGFEAALQAFASVLEQANAHIEVLDTWAESDPSIERDPPGLALETAA